MNDTRQVLIRSGGDWYDASADVLTVPVTIDIAAERKAWQHWYETEYDPACKAHNDAPQKSKPKCPKFITFIEWLKLRGCTDGTIEEFDDE